MTTHVNRRRLVLATVSAFSAFLLVFSSFPHPTPPALAKSTPPPRPSTAPGSH
jgi:hypothetical protein